MQLESNHKKTVDHLDATLEQKKMEYSQLGTEHGRLMVEQCNWNPSVMRVDEVIQQKKRYKYVEEVISPKRAKHFEGFIGEKDRISMENKKLKIAMETWKQRRSRC